jgi:hypothetical protein
MNGRKQLYSIGPRRKKVLITYLFLILLSCMTHCYYKGFFDLSSVAILVRHNLQVVASIPGNDMPVKLFNFLTPFYVFLAGHPTSKQFTHLIDAWTK